MEKLVAGNFIYSAELRRAATTPAELEKMACRLAGLSGSSSGSSSGFLLCTHGGTHGFAQHGLCQQDLGH